ncbi:hypothetical protein F4780DRAFT_753494 [Xylariomycetidae sp. FL0641]|nr:hypothetical protein F4780DRAFT_753494 [Xylariomycetidae sp. FL0641]
MGSKRAAVEDEGERTIKKPREHATHRDRVPKVNNSSIDQTYGQRGAFGDLQNLSTVPTGDSDLECEDDTDALAYLRTVRAQASTIPHIIAAKRAGPSRPPRVHDTTAADGKAKGDSGDDVDRSIYQNGIGDFRGYYHDGAYTAYPENYFDEEEDAEEEDEDEGEADEATPEDGEGEWEDRSTSEDGPHNSSADEIRDAYFTSIIRKYERLRDILQRDPPAMALLSLPPSNPTEVGPLGCKLDTFTKWSTRLRTTDPLPAQVAGMHRQGVMVLLRIITNGKFIRKGHVLRERTSRWIWALLARLPEQGELDYREIGWIRELGKRAVLLMVSLAELEVLREHYDVGGSSRDSQDEAEGDVDEMLEEGLGVDWYGEDDDSVQQGATSGDGKTQQVQPEGDPATHTNGSDERPDTASAAEPPSPKPTSDTSAPPTDEPSDIEMALDSDAEDGEVAETATASDIEAAKARLLKQLEPSGDDSTGSDEAAEAEREGRVRALVNERATLNMILTVAGEFYGQRDLLEFRDPFGGLHLE